MLIPRGSARRGLLVPQSGPYPATIIPLSGGGGPHIRDTRGDDYAGSDVQSIGVFEGNRIQNIFQSSLHKFPINVLGTDLVSTTFCCLRYTSTVNVGITC
jgi:hypothetical protein